MSTQLINDSLNPICELAQTAFIAELAQNKELFTASVLCFNSLSHLHWFSSGGEDYEHNNFNFSQFLSESCHIISEDLFKYRAWVVSTAFILS